MASSCGCSLINTLTVYHVPHPLHCLLGGSSWLLLATSGISSEGIALTGRQYGSVTAATIVALLVLAFQGPLTDFVG